MHVHGRCHCGQLAYHATIDPARTAVCHCTDCQSLSGSAFRVVAFTAPDAFTLERGELTRYVKLADSGNPREQAFCPVCGSAIYATSTGDGPKIYGLRVGTLVERAALVPRLQVWTHSAVPWLHELGALPARERQA